MFWLNLTVSLISHARSFRWVLTPASVYRWIVCLGYNSRFFSRLSNTAIDRTVVRVYLQILVCFVFRWPPLVERWLPPQNSLVEFKRSGLPPQPKVTFAANADSPQINCFESSISYGLNVRTDSPQVKPCDLATDSPQSSAELLQVGSQHLNPIWPYLAKYSCAE